MKTYLATTTSTILCGKFDANSTESRYGIDKLIRFICLSKTCASNLYVFDVKSLDSELEIAVRNDRYLERVFRPLV